MQDREIAYLVLTVASRADGGCVDCIQGCLDEAVFQSPDLPWEEALEDVRPTSKQAALKEALVAARGHLSTGGSPRIPRQVDAG